MNIRKISVLIFLVLLFSAGVVAGYLYFSKAFSDRARLSGEQTREPSDKVGDVLSLRIYFPEDDQIKVEEKKVPRKTNLTAIAEAVVEEYLRSTAAKTKSSIPKDTKLLGLYRDADNIIYVDLSDEFRRNFQGDAKIEFFLLKGLYESLTANVQDIEDVKILIEGREIETLGGHLYLSYPLKNIVSHELVEGKGIE
ncbi:MAG: GerMN domain-containing protein [Nitrospirota bacterium]